MNTLTPVAHPNLTSAVPPSARLDLPRLAVDLAMAVAGFLLVSLSTLAPERISVTLIAVAFTLAAVLEVAAGARLSYRGGPGMARLMAGATGLGFAAFALALSAVRHDAFIVAPIALLLGVHCICNAVIRSLDLAISRPPFALAQALSAVVLFGVGAAALELSHGAGPPLLATLTGSALVARGLFVGSTRSQP